MNTIDPMEHTGLVWKVLNSHKWLYGENSSWTDDDAYQEGMIALIQALQTYDSREGAVSTYCMNRIKWHLMREYKQQHDLIRKPDHLQEKYHSYRKAVSDYVKLYGKEPSDKYIAVILKTTTDSIRRMKLIFAPTVSLDAPIGSEDDDLTVADTIEDERDDFEDVDYRLQIQQLRRDLERMMDEKLTSTDQTLVKDYYAWYGGRQPTYKALGEIHGMTADAAQRKIISCLLKFRKFRAELTRNYPDLLMKQIYTQHRFALEDLTGMRKYMIRRYLVIGDLVKVNDHYGTVGSIDYELNHFEFIWNGQAYDINIGKVYDVDMTGGRISSMFTGVLRPRIESTVSRPLHSEVTGYPTHNSTNPPLEA